VPYFHVVFTLPGPIADIAYHNKAVVYDLLLKTAAETLITIAADPKQPRRPHWAHRRAAHLGISTDPTIRTPISSSRAAACRPSLPRRRPGASTGLPAGPASFSPSRCSHVCSAVCSWKGSRPPTKLGDWSSFADHAGLAEPARFKAYVARTAKGRMGRLCQTALWRTRRCARLPVPLHSPDRYCHSRLVAFDGTRVTLKWKDYAGPRPRPLQADDTDVNEFIRRFLIHVLPDGFHRIRHYGSSPMPIGQAISLPPFPAPPVPISRVPDPAAPSSGERRRYRNSARR